MSASLQREKRDGKIQLDLRQALRYSSGISPGVSGLAAAQTAVKSHEVGQGGVLFHRPTSGGRMRPQATDALRRSGPKGRIYGPRLNGRNKRIVITGAITNLLKNLKYLSSGT